MHIIHASAVCVEGKAILILGKSGFGKSTFALDLLDQCSIRGIEAILICDDQIGVETIKESINLHAPIALRGMIEIYGSGIHKIPFVESAQLFMTVRLVEASEIVRMPVSQELEILPSVFVSCLDLPNKSFAAVRILLAKLGHYGGVLLSKEST
jgi:HPr kinase/phosphorylase